MSAPGTQPSADQLAAAARAQADLPGAEVSNLRRAWEDRLADIWAVTVESAEGKRNAFLRVADGRVAVPAGLDQAARELRELRALEGPPWGGGLIYIVVAAGGATPGFPDTWTAEETPLADGGVRVTVEMPEPWVAYAAAGGVGPVPGGPRGGGGLAPRPTMATATLDIGADYSLQWRYQLGGGEIDGPAGAPAGSPPALPADRLVGALDGARRRARAPRAMPAREPRPLDGRPDLLVVDLWALGPVYVPLGGQGAPTSPAISWDAPPSDLLPQLSAADALPPGIVPADLLETAQVVGGELVATLPASLLAWSAAGARGASPRAASGAAGPASDRSGRVRLALDGSLRWTLEVADGAGWQPARGDAPPLEVD